MNNINVCFITDESYAMPTGVAIRSLIENAGKKSRYNIYIVAVNLDEKSIKNLKKIQTNKCRIIIKQTENMYNAINTKHPHVSKAALLKFDLPNILSNLDKVLYLDGDILVLNDLSELYNTDLNDKYAAVVPDMAGMLYEGHHLKLGFGKYFNSGVMLLNLGKMRNDKISEKLLDYKLNKDAGHFMDQDCLNYVFQENVIYVSPMYNWMASNQTEFTDEKIKDFYKLKQSDLDNIRKKTTVLHLTNRKKPWNSYDVIGSDIWHKYYKDYQFKIDKYGYVLKKIKNLFYEHKFYPNGRHKFYILGIRVLSYKPRFAPGAKVKGNFLYTKEKCPNGCRHIYICGIKVFSYSKKKKGAKSVVVQRDLVDNYRSVFEKNGYHVVRENDKIKIWNNIITVEGEADNTLWTAESVFCADEYNFDMDEKYVMFDIGFNLGMTSLHKAQDKNCVKIYAFEPFVPTYKLAMRNMELNKNLAKKITAFNYGLGDKEETIDVNYNHDRPGAMSSVKNVFSDCQEVEKIHIKNTSDVLAPLFAKHKEKIFLKIDCEGAEKQILPDLEKSGLIKKVDVIVMEWHFEEPTMLVDLLLRNNFIVFRLNSVPHELGMIRAYRRK